MPSCWQTFDSTIASLGVWEQCYTKIPLLPLAKGKQCATVILSHDFLYIKVTWPGFSPISNAFLKVRASWTGLKLYNCNISTLSYLSYPLLKGCTRPQTLAFFKKTRKTRKKTTNLLERGIKPQISALKEGLLTIRPPNFI